MRYFLCFFIALKYSFTNKKNTFLAFINLFTGFGIFLGTCALIVAFAVMNGFQTDIKSKVLGTVTQLTLISENTVTKEELEKFKQNNKEIIAYEKFNKFQGVINANNSLQIVDVFGVDLELEKQNNLALNSIKFGNLKNINKDSIIISQDIANLLGLTLGDKLTLYLPKQRVYTPFGTSFMHKTLSVEAIFLQTSKTDTNLVFIDLNTSNLLQNKKNLTEYSYRFYLTDPFLVPQVIENLEKNFNQNGYIFSSWQKEYGNLFNAIALEKKMILVILSLLIFVAAFNLISSLVMLINDKQKDIAIFLSLGLDSKNITLIFLFQGLITSCIGAFFGFICGSFFVYKIDFFAPFLNLPITDIGESLPVKLSLLTNFYLASFGVVFSALVAIYPALKATKINIARELNHE